MDEAGSGSSIVVTGLGLNTSIGNDVNSFWNSIKNGKSGIKEVQGMELEACNAKIGAQIDTFSKEYEELLAGNWNDRGLQLTLSALKQAVEHCRYNFDAELIDKKKVGVVIGTCSGGVYSGQKWIWNYVHNGVQHADPQDVLQYYYNTVSEMVSCVLEAKGPVMTISTACSSSNNAIGLASDLIASGKADMMFVGGYDPLTETVYHGFNSVDALDLNPCKPYSADRKGLTLGEGAGIIVLERKEHAMKRKVSMLGQVLGYGLAADGYHPTAPHPEGKGAARATTIALRHANITPTDVDYINGHGTGTTLNDVSETNAIIAALGDEAFQIPVSSTKAMTGHTLGASGVIEGIATLCSMNDGYLPPTIGLHKQDPQLPLDYVPNDCRAKEVNIAISNSFAFGGNNAVVIFGKPEIHRENKQSNHNIVITGIGGVTPSGSIQQHFWKSLMNPSDFTTDINTDKGKIYGTRKVGKINIKEVEQHFNRKEVRRLDRSGIISLFSVQQALEQAGIEMGKVNSERIGIVSGHAFSAFEHFIELYRPVLEKGQRVRPSVFPNSVYNGTAGYIAAQFQLLGPTSTFSGNQASSAMGLVQAYELLRKGDADVMVVLGSDAISDEFLDALSCTGVLSNEMPRPFDKDRKGVLASEAGVALILETEEHAKSRGANILARLSDYAIHSDAKIPNSQMENPDGIFNAMHDLTRSIPNEKPDYIFTSAAGSMDDRVEALAIQALFGEDFNHFTAIKSAIGETWGASSLLNVAASILSMKHGAVPATHHFIHPEQDIKVTPILDAKTDPSIHHTLVNSVNSGGTNFSFLIESYHENKEN